ncbi:MAG TPA: IS5 family transposase [Cytophagales bacterium]|nr:IS5 family transposase [Cytophagales bacterium]HAP60519.1 IS5 family transposase [Cytophagales bacterium]
MSRKKRGFSTEYVSPNQLSIAGFDTGFSHDLDPDNRWVKLSSLIPWDEIVSLYDHSISKDKGRPNLNGRVVVGSLIIQWLEGFTDRQLVQHIGENLYMQYFLGYTGFTPGPPFDPSLLVELRKRLDMEKVIAINEAVLRKHGVLKTQQVPATDVVDDEVPKKGRVLYDATVCPQDIAYPTDLNLLNEARLITEKVIDVLYIPIRGERKPRTYRKLARKDYLNLAKKKRKGKKALRKGLKKQLGYLQRNLNTVEELAAQNYAGQLPVNLLGKRLYHRLLVSSTIYEQQQEMIDKNTRSVADRIVSISQPHVRPMTRGKSANNTEFGAKINVSLADGFAFLDQLSWGAFHEGNQLVHYLDQYYQSRGHYPAEVLADKLYCTRENRNTLKQMGIKLLAKPLGRPPTNPKPPSFSAGERNPIEGVFGQAKRAYGMNRITTKLRETSQTAIAFSLLAVNLARLLARQAAYALNIATFLALISRVLFNIKQILSPNRLQNAYLGFS